MSLLHPNLREALEANDWDSFKAASDKYRAHLLDSKTRTELSDTTDPDTTEKQTSDLPVDLTPLEQSHVAKLEFKASFFDESLRDFSKTEE